MTDIESRIYLQENRVISIGSELKVNVNKAYRNYIPKKKGVKYIAKMYIKYVPISKKIKTAIDIVSQVKPSSLAAQCLVGAQLNNEEDEPGTMDAGESQEWSFSSLDQPQAFLGSGLLHLVINDSVKCKSHPEDTLCRFS